MRRSLFSRIVIASLTVVLQSNAASGSVRLSSAVCGSSIVIDGAQIGASLVSATKSALVLNYMICWAGPGYSNLSVFAGDFQVALRNSSGKVVATLYRADRNYASGHALQFAAGHSRVSQIIVVVPPGVAAGKYLAVATQKIDYVLMANRLTPPTTRDLRSATLTSLPFTVTLPP